MSFKYKLNSIGERIQPCLTLLQKVKKPRSFIMSKLNGASVVTPYVVMKKFVKQTVMPNRIKSFLKINKASVQFSFWDLFDIFID